MAAVRAEVLAASRMHNHPLGLDNFNPYQGANTMTSMGDEGRSRANNVSRIKNMFQDSKPEDNRYGYSNRNNFGYADQNMSPEVKRKRDELIISTNRKNSDTNVPKTLDTNLVDPQKFFENTSHVQRFQFTRAIFAKMEEQTKQEQKKSWHPHRKLSPGRGRARSPTSPTRQGAPQERGRKLTHPQPTNLGVDNTVRSQRSRSTSDPRAEEGFYNRGQVSRPNIPSKPDYLRSSSANRAESLDRLDNDYARRRNHDDGLQNRFGFNYLGKKSEYLNLYATL